jgi:hypothetical protein
VFHRRNKDIPDPPLASPRPRVVRVLQGPQELHEAVERAREFERRGVHEYQRRIGDYDRFLVQGAGPPANVVPIDPSRAGDPLPEPDQQLGTERP